MKRVPYGESSYKKIINEDMYFIDKTKYIEILEDMSKYQFFIRPRRFGKSLFLSMLETYYDILEKDNFMHYFGNTYIGKNKTKEANSYLVMRISFSDIVTDMGKDILIRNIETNIFNAVVGFLDKYKEFICFDANNLKGKNISEIMNTLRLALKQSSQKMYLCVDEYDNFANGLMIKDEEMYRELVQTDGYIKTFYKSVKEATAEDIISRIFITGVSPILLDDLTSGANIFTNISLREKLNGMMGVTQGELEKIIEEYKLYEYIDKQELLVNMKELYNGYKFSSRAVETLYNTGMIMYIVLCVKDEGYYPTQMLDDNIKTDYGKIRALAKSFESRDELRSIVEENSMIGPMEIKTQFGVEQIFNQIDQNQNFFSLLYYLGLLTIKVTEGASVYLAIPNYSVKTMYWEYLNNSYEITAVKKTMEIKLAAMKLRKDGNPKPIMDIYNEIRNSLSNRDLSNYNEMTSKAIFITLMFIDNTYILESEKEVKRGYTDLYLKEGILYKEEILYRYLIEFKHIKTSEHTKEKLEEKRQQAKAQLERYVSDQRLFEDTKKPLRKMIVITIGKKECFWEEIL